MTLVGPGTARSINTIHPYSSECKTEPKNLSSLICELQPGKEYELDSFKWENYTKLTIKGKGNSFFLKHPKCSDKDRNVHIYNASRVTTDQPENGCSVQLFLYNCTGVTIVGGVSRVRLESSKAEKVILPEVTQFDVYDSRIGEVSLTITSKKSTLHNSTIELVNKLVINGSFIFQMKDCKLGHVKEFIYINDQTQTQDLMVDRVSPYGIQVFRGSLNFEAIFDVVEPDGIVVMPEAALSLKFGEIRTFSEDSIVVMPGGMLSLHNMTLGQNLFISFTFGGASVQMYPVSFLKPPWVAPMGWIAIGVAFGLVVGSVTTAAMTYFVKHKKRSFSANSVDTNKLLSQEQSSPQTEKDTDSLVNKHNLPKSMPAPPNRPLPNVPTRMSDMHYDDVVTALSPPPTEMAPLPEVAQRPPCALPKESQSTKPSLHRSIKDRFCGKSNFLPPVMKHSKQDPRDALPPPPPPAEELYDDLEDMNLQLPPLPPTTNRPQLPVTRKDKPLPRPVSDEELYDDVGDMSLQPPPPPPSANKPKLSKGKPVPPPPLRKPKVR